MGTIDKERSHAADPHPGPRLDRYAAFVVGQPEGHSVLVLENAFRNNLRLDDDSAEGPGRGLHHLPPQHSYFQSTLLFPVQHLNGSSLSNPEVQVAHVKKSGIYIEDLAFDRHQDRLA